ncbi:MAG: type VI secretion system lipoprotein TssJ [Proteobacteria bacterium]|nr:type VI secretion system lipoprotein TssJ [Pseudomonadota bacterium]
MNRFSEVPARRAVGSVIVVVALAALAGGCASKPPAPPPPPPPVVMSLAVHLASDGNPDGEGRASPVVVRIYQLRSEDAFKGLDLEALYYRDKDALAADLVARDEWTLRPGEAHDSKWQLAPEVRAIAVVGALRSYRAVPWRVSIPVLPATNLATAQRSVQVEIGRDGVHLGDGRPDKSR